MTVKTYLKLLLHAVITMLIILSVPITLRIILSYNGVPDWIITVSSLASASVTLFFGIKYVIFIVWKKDIFKDMF